MLYLPITRNWIISRTARTVYLVCTVLAFALFGALFAITLAMAHSQVRSLSPFPLALDVARLVLLPGILGTATLTVAMWYFWFGFDKSSWIRKAFWFLPLYFLLPIGPAFYYFFVYRRIAEISVRTANDVQPVRK
jgi:hypothetical protein